MRTSILKIGKKVIIIRNVPDSITDEDIKKVYLLSKVINAVSRKTKYCS